MSRGLDELRFGPERTLNLRETLPTARDAVERCDKWLREQQIRGAREVLIITGRGSHSVGGIAVIKQAIEKLLFALRRRGVVGAHAEHNPGAFAVTLAPLRALSEAAARRKDPRRAVPDFAFEGLSADSVSLLRDLAERSLDGLGVDITEERVRDEMHRHLRLLAPGLAGREIDSELRAVIRRAIAEYD
ncbi:MAG: Smr/MutS family protein [Gemmatimonadaceae bacterium]